MYDGSVYRFVTCLINLACLVNLTCLVNSSIINLYTVLSVKEDSDRMHLNGTCNAFIQHVGIRAMH